MKLKWWFLLGLLLMSQGMASGQQVDSLKALELKRLEQELDSLRQALRQTFAEIQDLKASMLRRTSDMEELLALFSDEPVEKAPAEQRSRKKRVDALLKAITQQPGQLRFNGSLTFSTQVFSYENRTHSAGVGSFDLFASTAFGPNTLLFVDLESIGGNGPSFLLPSFLALNGDAGSTQSPDGVDRMQVLEAWLEFSALKENVKITAGKIDLTNYFDNNASANDETSQFLAQEFVNNATLAVPGNSPGLRLRTTLLNRFYVQAVQSAQITPARISLTNCLPSAAWGSSCLPTATGKEICASMVTKIRRWMPPAWD